MRVTTIVSLAALCTVLAFFGAPAAGAPGIGDKAPAFEGKEFLNTPEVTLADLKGQVIFYEIFRTW